MRLNQKMERPLYLGVSVFLLGLIAFSVVFATAVGSTDIPFKSVLGVIGYEMFHLEKWQAFASGAVHDVIWLMRLPRVLLAIAVGGGLSVCGIAMQAVVKNPLADPYVLGVSSGASLGATLAILLGIGLGFGTYSVGIVAFIGAFVASLLVMAIANIGSRANAVKLLLSGMAVSAVFSSFSSFIVFFANDKEGIQTITFWLMGSLSGANWTLLPILFIVTLGGSFFFYTQSRRLNLMLLGDETSITLGVDLHKHRHIYMIVVSLMIGFIVFSSGMIGFIGLIVPHLARMVFGTEHRKIIPISFLVGGLFMIWADVLARTLIPYTELPIGILISMVGAPCFIYLLVRKSYGFGGNH